MERLAELAAALEQAFADNNKSEHFFTALLEELETILKGLEQWLKQQDNSPVEKLVKQTSLTEQQRLLDELQVYIEQDSIEALTIAEQLSNMFSQADEQALMSNINHAISKYDFDTAIAQLEVLRSKLNID